MDLSRYINRADYTTEMHLHDGTVEVIKHCGRCRLVIWKQTGCEHCAVKAAKDDEKKEKFKQFLATKKASKVRHHDTD